MFYFFFFCLEERLNRDEFSIGSFHTAPSREREVDAKRKRKYLSLKDFPSWSFDVDVVFSVVDVAVCDFPRLSHSSSLASGVIEEMELYTAIQEVLILLSLVLTHWVWSLLNSYHQKSNLSSFPSEWSFCGRMALSGVYSLWNLIFFFNVLQKDIFIGTLDVDERSLCKQLRGFKRKLNLSRIYCLKVGAGLSNGILSFEIDLATKYGIENPIWGTRIEFPLHSAHLSVTNLFNCVLTRNRSYKPSRNLALVL